MSAKTLDAVADAIKAHLKDIGEEDLLVDWVVGCAFLDGDDMHGISYFSNVMSSAASTSGLLHLASRMIDDAILGCEE